MPALHLPGHHYLGPGSRRDPRGRRKPVDRDDAIAEQHDIAYEKAKTSTEVREADKKAILEFSSDAFHNRNYHSAIGAIGLGTKYAVESLTGVLYPRISDETGKRSFSHSSSSASGSSLQHSSGFGQKRKTLHNPDPILSPRRNDLQRAHIHPRQRRRIRFNNEEMASASAVGANQPYATTPDGGGDAQVTPPIPQTIRTARTNPTSRTFTKSFQLYTCGYQFKVMNSNANATLNASFKDKIELISEPQKAATLKLLNTPYAVLDPNFLPLYMTHREFDDLPVNSYASECRIKVTPLGYRLPFQTNSQVVTYANSVQMIQIGYNVGANMDLNGFVSSYKATAPDYTKVTELDDITFSGHTLYGDDYSNDPPDLGACIGIPRHLNVYWSPIIPPTSKTYSSPLLTKLYTIQNLLDVEGTTIIDYTHTFKMGVLKFPQSGINSLKVNDIPEGARTLGWWFRNSNKKADSTDTSTPPITTKFASRGMKDGLINQGNGRFAYDAIIEKASGLQRNMGHFQEPDDVPFISFGVLPVQTNPALAASATFANVSVIWKIETEIVVNSNLDYPFASNDVAWIQSWDPNWGLAAEDTYWHANDWHFCIQGRRMNPNSTPSYNGAFLTQTSSKSNAPAFMKKRKPRDISQEQCEKRKRQKYSFEEIDEEDNEETFEIIE